MAHAETAPSQHALRRGIPLWMIVLLGALGVLLAVAALIAWAFHSRQKALHSSPVFSMALMQAGHAPCVAERLGSPLVSSGFTVGSVSSGNGQGYADLEIPIHGPHADGHIHVVANQTGNFWQVQYLSVRTGDDRLLLLPASPPCQ